MSEYHEFTPKVEEILGKTDLIADADAIIYKLRIMTTFAEKCNLRSLFRSIESIALLHAYILDKLTAAATEGRISFKEIDLVNHELRKISDKYKETIIRIFKEKCTCRPREE